MLPHRFGKIRLSGRRLSFSDGRKMNRNDDDGRKMNRNDDDDRKMN